MKDYIKDTLLMIFCTYLLSLIAPGIAGLMGLCLMGRIVIIMLPLIGFPIYVFMEWIEG